MVESYTGERLVWTVATLSTAVQSDSSPVILPLLGQGIPRYVGKLEYTVCVGYI